MKTMLTSALLAMGALLMPCTLVADDPAAQPVPPTGPSAELSEAAQKDEATYTRTVADSEHTLALTTAKDHEDHLLLTDKAGKVIFDGPVATEAQLAKLPAGIAAKLQRLQQKLTIVEEEEPAAAAPAATLHVGDPAPALAASKWIKGEVVKKFEPGKIYIVEFWATWCGPCAEAIPHLTELQKQNAEVTFIGMNCLEEDQAVVPEFVKKKGDKMGYRVALDDAAGNVAKAWLTAAAQGGIPCTFVVGKDGKIAWIGHPMKLDNVLKQVVAGTFDAKTFAAAEQQEAAGEEEIQAKIAELVDASDLGGIDKLIKDHPKSVELQKARFTVLLQSKHYSEAIALAKVLCESQKDNADVLYQIALALTNPDDPGVKPGLEVALKAALRANEVVGPNPAVLATIARVYSIRGDMDKAIEYQTKAVEKEDEDNENRKALLEYKAKKGGVKGTSASAAEAPAKEAKQDQPESAAQLAAAIHRVLQNKDFKDNPNVLNLMAWSMVDPEVPVDKPDLDLALKVALRADELAKGQSGEILDTLARVNFMRGDVDKAIELQTKAVEKSAAPEKEKLQKTLSEYKAKKASPK